MVGIEKKGFQLPFFNLRLSPQGRLSMVCKLELDFHGRDHSLFSVEHWERFLLKHYDEDKLNDVQFPSLELLLLHFGSWRLKADDKLVVRQLPISLSFLGVTITNNCLPLDSALCPYV